MKFIAVFTLIVFCQASEQFVNVATDLFDFPSQNVVQSKIVNGFAASANQFPHQALVFINTLQGTYQCGGSLISNIWVLSAAHCVIGATAATVKLGSTNRNSMPVQRSAVEVNRLNTYNPNTLKDDISLIKLNSSVSILSNVKTIKLPSSSQVLTSFLGDILTVSGFGLTTSNQVSTTLQYSKVIGISNAECRTFYGSVITSSILCTRGYPNRNQGSCQGDSGGPLITSNSTLIGLVSFGAAQSCSAGYPQGFTRIAPYLGWINNVTGISVN